MIDPSAFRTALTDLAIYVPKDTAGYQAAVANDLLWAKIDETQQRLCGPAFIQVAIVHAEEAKAKLPLHRKATHIEPM